MGWTLQSGRLFRCHHSGLFCYILTCIRKGRGFLDDFPYQQQHAQRVPVCDCCVFIYFKILYAYYRKKKEGHISILFYFSVLDIILSMCPFALEVRSSKGWHMSSVLICRFWMLGIHKVQDVIILRDIWKSTSINTWFFY